MYYACLTMLPRLNDNTFWGFDESVVTKCYKLKGWTRGKVVTDRLGLKVDKQPRKDAIK